VPVFMSYVLSFIDLGIYRNKLQYVNYLHDQPVAQP
jgi:hypothetical protein